MLMAFIGGFVILSSTAIFAAERPEVAKDSATHQGEPARLARVIAVMNRGGCSGCHVIPGIPGADGEVGPDLSLLGKVAGIRRKNTSAKDYIKQAIIDPDAFIAPDGTDNQYPAGVMLQSFGQSLNKNDLQLLVDYLADLGVKAIPRPNTAAEPVSLRRDLPEEAVLQPFAKLPVPIPTAEEIALGQALFFDRRLSANNSLSCASCHQPDKAFTDGLPVSRGYPSTKLFRNTPSLLNTAFRKRFYRDGRIGDLPSTIRDHLTEAHFMAADGRLLIERLRQTPAYVERFQSVYKSEPRFGKILNALTAYVHSLNSTTNGYDHFASFGNIKLSPAAIQGANLFTGKAGCVKCHQGRMFSDGKFHNLGLNPPGELLNDPERRVTFRRFFRVLGLPDYRQLTHDPGLRAMTLKPEDDGKFRTPGLRDVARTAPYMHAGQLATLKDVVEFYNAGGGQNQTAELKPLNLTDGEIHALVDFLKSLNSEPVTIKIPESPPYAVIPRVNQVASETVDRHTLPTGSGRASRKVDYPPLTILPPVPSPADNPTTTEKVELGKLLFFDPRMSGDGSTSCHSCHAVTTGGTIRTAISMGGPGTSHWRNSQTILNVGYYGKLNWDGSKSSIEKQNEGAWTGAVAGNLDVTLAEERLAAMPRYVQRFRNVFGTQLPRWPDALRAVAAFQRTLITRNAPFDRYIQGDETALTDSARRGLKLFNGKANCIQCHNGALVSDDGYHALGVPEHPTFKTSPLKQITFRYELAAKGVPQSTYRNSAVDDGLYYVTKRLVDRGKFRTPTLRDLTHTAPYMHNGVLESLQDVVSFYNTGGGNSLNKSPLVKPLGLTAAEQRDLVEFLKSLSGDTLQIEAPKLPQYEETKRVAKHKEPRTQ